MPMKRGVDNLCAKANDWLVRAIRSNPYEWSYRTWAKLTGLGYTTIENIATYQSWIHVR